MYKRKHKQERSKDKSTKMMHIRLTAEEYDEYKNRAALLDTTLSDYVRTLLRKGSYNIFLKNVIEIDSLKSIAAEYGRIGNNINQIAHHLNSGLSWSRTLLADMNKNLGDMEKATKELSATVRDINADYRTTGKKKYRL